MYVEASFTEVSPTEEFLTRDVQTPLLVSTSICISRVAASGILYSVFVVVSYASPSEFVPVSTVPDGGYT